MASFVVIIIVGIDDLVEGIMDGNGMRDGDGMGGVGTEDVLLDGDGVDVVGDGVDTPVGSNGGLLVGGLLLLLVVVGEGVCVGVGGTVVVRMDGVCVGGIVIGTVGFGADVGAGSLATAGD